MEKNEQKIEQIRLGNTQVTKDIDNFFPNTKQKESGNLNFCYKNYDINNKSNIYNNVSQNSPNYYSIMNNNINNFYYNTRIYNIFNNNCMSNNNTNENILINIIDANINKYKYNNYQNCKKPNNVNNISDPYNRILSFPFTQKYYNSNKEESKKDFIDYNNIHINNINNIHFYNKFINNINNNDYIKINYLDKIKNNIIENNNLNNTIFTNNNKAKEIQNIKGNYIKNNMINSNQPININEFLTYINSLPMPLVDYLCTSKGILEIQRKLPKSIFNYKTFIILIINKDGLSKIMKNTYGNYFFQQLIKDSEKQFISLIISYITDNFINISKDPCGTFSLQALLDEVSTYEEEQKILNCIKNHEMEMAYDKNATHVLKKLILLFPDAHRHELNEIILNNLKDLCLDSNGICLIKNFIRSNTLINDKKRINEEIINNFITLAESPFGNYGIQFLMENWDKDMLKDIKDKIIDNLCRLSIHQFSSNVVEKAIEIFDEEYKEKIIKKLCFEDDFIVFLRNKFGRFVLCKAINYMKDDLKIELENKLKNNLNNKTFKNRDKIKIKKFILKLQYRKNSNYLPVFNKNLFINDYVSNNIDNTCMNNNGNESDNENIINFEH